MRWIASLLLAVGLLVAVPTAVSAAGGDPPSCPGGSVPQEVPQQGWICVPVVNPGEEGSEQGGGASGENTGGGGPATCARDGVEIPCTSDLGVWFAEYGCYAVQGNLPPSAPEWGGHDPSDGSVWLCNNPLDQDPVYFFVPVGQNPVPTLVDPAVLAQGALDRMQLVTPDVHMAPQPPLMSYVGLETWLWMDPGQWDTLDVTVTAGATSVTVTAAPVRATWDLTAGSTTCTSAGREWVKGMNEYEQTGCSYTFDEVSDGQPDDAFPVTATLTYQVDWTCSGACMTPSGTLGEVDGVPGSAAIRVGERQSVVITKGN